MSQKKLWQQIWISGRRGGVVGGQGSGTTGLKMLLQDLFKPFHSWGSAFSSLRGSVTGWWWYFQVRHPGQPGQERLYQLGLEADAHLISYQWYVANLSAQLCAPNAWYKWQIWTQYLILPLCWLQMSEILSQLWTKCLMLPLCCILIPEIFLQLCTRPVLLWLPLCQYCQTPDIEIVLLY